MNQCLRERRVDLRNLNRPPEAPVCLAKYKHGRDLWENVNSSDRKIIWDSLYDMQGKFCAYCECALIDNKKHIEHFLQKGRVNSKTFAWENLFGSCRYHDRCGVFKDKQKYADIDLIKADRDEPEKYFNFLSNGSIRPKTNLSPQDTRKAEETIRVFKLDEELTQMRFAIIFPFIETAEYLFELIEELSGDEWLTLFNAELESVENSPFYSAIKSVLMLNTKY